MKKPRLKLIHSTERGAQGAHPLSDRTHRNWHGSWLFVGGAIFILERIENRTGCNTAPARRELSKLLIDLRFAYHGGNGGKPPKGPQTDRLKSRNRRRK